jgi:hypothetical protein
MAALVARCTSNWRNISGVVPYSRLLEFLLYLFASSARNSKWFLEHILDVFADFLYFRRADGWIVQGPGDIDPDPKLQI